MKTLSWGFPAIAEKKTEEQRPEMAFHLRQRGLSLFSASRLSLLVTKHQNPHHENGGKDKEQSFIFIKTDMVSQSH